MARESGIPIRRRMTAMPGDIGHAWVKKRFMSKTQPVERKYIPSLLDDNPFLDREDYIKSLQEMPLFERNQKLCGDWSEFSGKFFRPADWPTYHLLEHGFRFGYAHPVLYHQNCYRFVTVDWAVTAKGYSDYTAICAWALTPDRKLLLLDVFNERRRKEEAPKELAVMCRKWSPQLVAGEDDILSQFMMIACREVQGIPEIRVLPVQSRDKLQRAMPAIIWGENGRIFHPDPEPDWWEVYKTQLAAFTGDQAGHDDLVDCTAIAVRLAEQLKSTLNAYEDNYGVEFFCPGYQG
jgi:predicted phage terminase large subunit-like protein